jgi:hypothetical protein
MQSPKRMLQTTWHPRALRCIASASWGMLVLSVYNTSGRLVVAWLSVKPVSVSQNHCLGWLLGQVSLKAHDQEGGGLLQPASHQVASVIKGGTGHQECWPSSLNRRSIALHCLTHTYTAQQLSLPRYLCLHARPLLPHWLGSQTTAATRHLQV